jgi:hypothetical protein
VRGATCRTDEPAAETPVIAAVVGD